MWAKLYKILTIRYRMIRFIQKEIFRFLPAEERTYFAAVALANGWSLKALEEYLGAGSLPTPDGATCRQYEGKVFRTVFPWSVFDFKDFDRTYCRMLFISNPTKWVKLHRRQFLEAEDRGVKLARYLGVSHPVIMELLSEE